MLRANGAGLERLRSPSPQRLQRNRQRRLYPLLDEAGFEAADGGLFGEVGVGEVVICVHVGGDDEEEDVEGAGHVEAELDMRRGDQAAAEEIAFPGRVAFEVDVDDGRERVSGRVLGEDRRFRRDGAPAAEAAQAPGDGRGRTADPLGEAIGGLEIVLLKTGEELQIEAVIFAGRCRFTTPICQNLASARRCLPEKAAAPKG